MRSPGLSVSGSMSGFSSSMSESGTSHFAAIDSSVSPDLTT